MKNNDIYYLLAFGGAVVGIALIKTVVKKETKPIKLRPQVAGIGLCK